MKQTYKAKVKAHLGKRGIQIFPFSFTEAQCKAFWKSGWIDCGEFELFGKTLRYMGFKPPEK
jgi:hypothetical protein